jgi:hypothetical protein
MVPNIRYPEAKLKKIRRGANEKRLWNETNKRVDQDNRAFARQLLPDIYLLSDVSSGVWGVHQ